MSSSFSVCIRHFEETDYVKKSETEFKLNRGAVPTIFENVNNSSNHPNNTSQNNSIDTAASSNDDCFNEIIVCDDGTEITINTVGDDDEILPNGNDIFVHVHNENEGGLIEANLKIDHLKTELVNLKTAHDIAVQKYEKKIRTMEDRFEEKRDKLEQTMTDLRHEKSKNERLEVLNKELRSNHIALASIANVIPQFIRCILF